MCVDINYIYYSFQKRCNDLAIARHGHREIGRRAILTIHRSRMRSQLVSVIKGAPSSRSLQFDFCSLPALVNQRSQKRSGPDQAPIRPRSVPAGDLFSPFPFPPSPPIYEIHRSLRDRSSIYRVAVAVGRESTTKTTTTTTTKTTTSISPERK